MALKQTTEQTVEPDIELTPKQQAELKLNLDVYAECVDALDDAKEAVEAQKNELERIRDKFGAKSIAYEGVGRVTLVDGGTTKKLIIKKLLAQGVTMAQIEAATVEKPKKPHTLVTLAKEKPAKKRQRHEDDEDDE